MVLATDEERTWRDSGVLINCLTISLVGFLVPLHPFTEHLYLTVATYAFAALATVNHLFPSRLHFLTHAVKAAYTNLLFASVAPSLIEASRWWSLPIALSILDLLPLVVRARRLRALAEGLGASGRWCLILLGFCVAQAPVWVLVTYAACTAVYFQERRRRIRSGRRFDYGWLHCLEHVAVWSFLLVVNASKLDRPLVWSLHLGGFVALAVALVIAGVVTNVRVFRAIERTLPPWFDPRLRDVILRKSRANAFSHRLQHYVIKPFTPKMINERVAWQDIEAMVARIPFAEGFDTIIGITSGGAFIARCVAARLGTQDVQYVQSRLWSRMPLHKNLVASFRYYIGRSNDTRVGFLGGDVDLSGKRVLLVDDSVCTGATLASVERFCRARGAVYVKTLALFVDPQHPTDYFFRMSKTPLVWPWGWESD